MLKLAAKLVYFTADFLIGIFLLLKLCLHWTLNNITLWITFHLSSSSESMSNHIQISLFKVSEYLSNILSISSMLTVLHNFFSMYFYIMSCCFGMYTVCSYIWWIWTSTALHLWLLQWSWDTEHKRVTNGVCCCFYSTTMEE